MKTHYIKINSQLFSQISHGEKRFTIDVANVSFMRNDRIIFCETINGTLTGKQLPPYKIDSGKYNTNGGFDGIISEAF